MFPADFISRLATRLAQPLPGAAAQRKFEPEHAGGRHFQNPPAARPAAVLILLYPVDGVWHLPLTVRPQQLPHHPGQVCLPGGAVDPGESNSEAALRELWEELGVETSGIELLGELSPLYVFASNYRISPWVGCLSHAPAWSPNPSEVAELLEVPLSHLLDPAHHLNYLRDSNGLRLQTPYFGFGSHRIWGATSMVLAELMELIHEI